MITGGKRRFIFSNNFVENEIEKLHDFRSIFRSVINLLDKRKEFINFIFIDETESEEKVETPKENDEPDQRTDDVEAVADSGADPGTSSEDPGEETKGEEKESSEGQEEEEKQQDIENKLKELSEKIDGHNAKTIELEKTAKSEEGKLVGLD